MYVCMPIYLKNVILRACIKSWQGLSKRMNEWMNGSVKLQWTIKLSPCLMVCSRTQGMTATLEDRGVCVCLKEEEKKSQRHNVWQSQPFTAPDTVWKSILTDTGLSGVNADQHHWNQEEQVGPYPFCFTWILLDGKGNIGTPVWTSLLGAGAFLGDKSFEGSSCTLVVLHWNYLSDVECWNTDLLWDSTALVLMSAGGKFPQVWKMSRCSHHKSDWRLIKKSKEVPEVDR